MDSGLPWSTNGDPTVVLIHEFAHQRQFRFLEEVGAVPGGQPSPVSNRAWSPLVRMEHPTGPEFGFPGNQLPPDVPVPISVSNAPTEFI